MAGHSSGRRRPDSLEHAASGTVKFLLGVWVHLAVIIVFDLLFRWNLELARADLRWFLAWCWPRWFDYGTPYPRSASR